MKYDMPRLCAKIATTAQITLAVVVVKNDGVENIIKMASPQTGAVMMR